MSIPQPRKDEKGKVIGDFYPLQRAELIALRKSKLINNAAYVHLALRFENPFCDRPIEIFPKEFAIRWQMPESSVYEAIAKLDDEKVINIKYGKVVIKWANSQEDEPIDSQEDDNSGNPESLRKSRKNSEFSGRVLDSQKRFRKSRKNSESSENQPPDPLPAKDSKTPHTIQTYSDFIKTLSESERENFLKFCEELTSNFSSPVNDIEAWLAHKNKAGQNRWEVYYQKFLVRQANVSKKTQSSRSSQMMKKFQLEIEQQQQQAIQTWESQV